MHLALARKYRPQDFTQLIGQDAVVKTLANSLTQNRLHHAYVFCGARGVGKTSMARIFSKSVNCENGPTLTPCQKCAMCVGITQGSALDVQEIDGASNNKVENIHEIREQVNYLPTSGRYKIFIIDEVHMLSTAAFNALLKTLEEPPPHVIFIFATTEAQKIPITILSRCQKFDFRKLNFAALSEHLEKILALENVQADADAVQLVARCAQGSVRDALSLLDQLISFGDARLTESRVRDVLGLADRILIEELTGALIAEDLVTALDKLDECDQRGMDLALLAEDVLALLRALIIFKATDRAPADISPSELNWITKLGSRTDLSILLAQQQILMHGLTELSRTEFPKTILEMTAVRMVQAQEMIDLASLVAEIRDKRMAAPAAQMPARPQPLRKSNEVQSTSSQAAKPVGLAVAVEVEEKKSNSPTAENWYDLVKWMQRERPPLAGMLGQVVPVTYSKNLIEVGFASDSPMRELLIERRGQVSDLIAKHFGHPVNFVIAENNVEKKKPNPLLSS